MRKLIKVQIAKKIGKLFDRKEKSIYYKYIIYTEDYSCKEVLSKYPIIDGDYILVKDDKVLKVMSEKPNLSVILKSFFLSMLIIFSSLAVDINQSTNNSRYFDTNRLKGGNVDKQGIRNFANQQKNDWLNSPKEIKNNIGKSIGYDEKKLNGDVSGVESIDAKQRLIEMMSNMSKKQKTTYTCYERKNVKANRTVYVCSYDNSTYTDIVQCNNNCKKVYECKQSQCVFAYECEKGKIGDGTDNANGDLCPLNRIDCIFQENIENPCIKETSWENYKQNVKYDSYQAVCYHQPFCRTNLSYEYNNDRDRCERTAEYYQEKISSSKHCPSSQQTYNPSTDRCEAFKPAYCPSGYTDVGTYCEYRYSAKYNPRTCYRYESCNPHPCNCQKVCSTDKDGNKTCSTECDTCYDTCRVAYDCSYYSCPDGGTLDGTTCVKTANQICRDYGYVYSSIYDQCIDFDRPNCNKSHPGAWFYPAGDYCYWYQCDPPKGGTLYTFLQGDKYQGICYQKAVCTFSGISGILDTIEDRCELNPCPSGTTPMGRQYAGSAGRCVLSTKDDIWNNVLTTYVWQDKPSPRWQCSPVSCSNRMPPENKAYCLDRQTNITVLNSNQVNTWFCEYEDTGGYPSQKDCQKGCNWYQCTKDGRWYQGADYICLQNCQERGECTTIGK